MYGEMHTFVQLYICVCMSYIYIYVYMYIYVYICIYIQIQMHTHTPHWICTIPCLSNATLLDTAVLKFDLFDFFFPLFLL